MSDVAKQAGVSRPTVSHVLNGRTENTFVSDKTRDRVLQAASSIGYKPNGSALAMKSGKFGNVALLLSTDTQRSGLPPQLWEGIHDELAARDLHLTIARLPDEKLHDAAVIPKILREWMCDGLLIDLTHCIPPALLQLIHSHQMPAVWINSKQEADSVYPDDFEAGRQAAEYLMELGHRRIAYLKAGAPPKGAAHYSESDRLAGVVAAIKTEGLQPMLLPAQGQAKAVTSQELLALLQSEERPTTIIGYGTDELTLVMLCAAQAGLQVPRDLSVLIFGEAQSATFGERAVSQMIVPQAQVGREAVKLLLRKIERTEYSAPPVAVPFALSEGELCASPEKK